MSTASVPSSSAAASSAPLNLAFPRCSTEVRIRLIASTSSAVTLHELNERRRSLYSAASSMLGTAVQPLCCRYWNLSAVPILYFSRSVSDAPAQSW